MTFWKKTLPACDNNGLAGGDLPGSERFDPDQVSAVLAAVDAAQPRFRFVTESIRRDLATASPEDIKARLAGIAAALRGGA